MMTNGYSCFVGLTPLAINFLSILIIYITLVVLPALGIALVLCLLCGFMLVNAIDFSMGWWQAPYYFMLATGFAFYPTITTEQFLPRLILIAISGCFGAFLNYVAMNISNEWRIRLSLGKTSVHAVIISLLFFISYLAVLLL